MRKEQNCVHTGCSCRCPLQPSQASTEGRHRDPWVSRECDELVNWQWENVVDLISSCSFNKLNQDMFTISNFLATAFSRCKFTSSSYSRETRKGVQFSGRLGRLEGTAAPCVDASLFLCAAFRIINNELTGIWSYNEKRSNFICAENLHGGTKHKHQQHSVFVIE